MNMCISFISVLSIFGVSALLAESQAVYDKQQASSVPVVVSEVPT